MSIICLPLSLGKRSLGVVNIYLSPEQNLDSGQQTFIEGLLDEMALAVETMRLHNQEINTLRQLRHLRSPRADLTITLQSLLDAVRNTLAGRPAPSARAADGGRPPFRIMREIR